MERIKYIPPLFLLMRLNRKVNMAKKRLFFAVISGMKGVAWVSVISEKKAIIVE